MIFSLRQIQEKCIEQQQDLFVVFIDFKKAFDSVDRDTLWNVLRRFGCPDGFISLIREFHDNMKGRVLSGKQQTDEFTVNHGTKQGCVLAPNLFTIFLTCVLLILHDRVGGGVYIRTRGDGKLFNLARLKARTRTTRELVTDLLFADDTALVAHTQADMQEIVDVFAQTSKKMGLSINVDKTEVMYQPAPETQRRQNTEIKVDGIPLKVVERFKYLGSTITTDNRVDVEIGNRIRNACVSFGKLEERLWARTGIKTSTKCQVYGAVVIPALLYSAETYTLYRGNIRRLCAVQQRQLRRILRVSWSDYVPNVEVLRRANMESVEATLAASQLRWAGHVHRMSQSRIPRFVMYG
jgi:hypothetical protein